MTRSKTPSGLFESTVSTNPQRWTGFKLQTCPCVCSKAVIEIASRIRNLTNSSKAIQKSLVAIQEKLQVNSTKLTTVVRKRISAADERGSSFSFGVIALVLLALEFFLLTLCDVMTVILYIKRKLVQVFCVSPGTDKQTGEQAGQINRMKERTRATEIQRQRRRSNQVGGGRE